MSTYVWIIYVNTIVYSVIPIAHALQNDAMNHTAIIKYVRGLISFYY